MKFNNKGQTLIEAIVALAFAAIVISAIAMVIITSLDNASFSKYQNLATHYAQEGIDIMRQKGETDWGTFSALEGNTYCLGQSTSTLQAEGTCTDNPNITNTIGLIRKISVDTGVGCNSFGKKVSVTVYWADGKCKDTSNKYCHRVTLDSCIAQINNSTIPGP